MLQGPVAGERNQTLSETTAQLATWRLSQQSQWLWLVLSARHSRLLEWIGVSDDEMAIGRRTNSPATQITQNNLPRLCGG
jgi:hypothetical protein